MRRRRFLALLLVLALLAGCSSTPEEPVETEPDTPEETAPGETARPEEPAPEQAAPHTFSLAYEPSRGFNPYQCTTQTNRTVLSLLYEPLFTVDSNFHASPYLCASYTSTGDGRTHTLRLRPNVTFSDGSPLTASDVAASLRAAMGSNYYGQRLRHVSTISVVSDTELTISTDAAVGALDALLSVYIVKSGTEGVDIPTGTGPYAAEGDSLRRTAWWRAQTPIPAEEMIRLVAADTPTAVRDNFEYGLADLVCTDPNAGTRVAYHSDFELWDNATSVMQYIGFNLNSPVFSYSAIRASLTHAINREAIVSETAAGFASAAILPASPNAACYSRQLAERYGPDESAFSALLDSCDVSDITGDDGILEFYTETGIQPLSGTMIVCLSSDQRVAAAQAVVNTLNERGFDLTLKPLEYEDYVEALEQGSFDLYYGEVRLSPDFDLSEFFNEGGSLSYGSIADAVAAPLCARAVENAGNAYDLHREIMDRGLLCPVLFKVYAIYTARGLVTGLTPCLDGVFLQPIPNG